MKTNAIKYLIVITIVSVTIFSCVPQRQFEDMKSERERSERARRELKGANESLTTANNEMEKRIERLERSNSGLILDSTVRGNAYRTLTHQYDKVTELYEQLLRNQEQLVAGADSESRKAMSLLLDTRQELQKKEDELLALEKRLNLERANLEALKIRLDMQEDELIEKNKKVMELQAILNSKDSVMNALRNAVAEALVGFEGEGLTVTMKDGKVYVSLDEKLLFETARWNVDTKGQQALRSLAPVLERNPDINIMIEGHTDDVPYRGSGNIEDNWDLSVKRATAIVKILLSNSKIDPSRITAAGRGPYHPVDPGKTTDARAKNRRTEIILTPKLDVLYEIMKDK